MEKKKYSNLETYYNKEPKRTNKVLHYIDKSLNVTCINFIEG